MTHPIQPTIIVAGNGHIFIAQGYYKPSLFIPRHDVPRFLADPVSTPIGLIPPFASTALDCYVSGVEVLAIHHRRNVPIGGETVLLFTLKSRSVGFFSSPNALRHPEWLAGQGVEIAITPKAFATIGTAPATVAIIASMPRTEKVSYKNRFALSPSSIRNELTEVIQRAQPLVYEN